LEEFVFRNPRKLGAWVCGLAILIGLIKIAGIGVELHLDGMREHKDALLNATTDRGPELASLTQHMQQIQQAHSLLLALEFILFLTNVVLFCIWLYRAAGNARALGARGFDYSPGWTVGWFFIPVAGFLMPYFTVREVWQSSENPMNWSSPARPVAVLLWWITYVAGSLTERISLPMLKKAGDDISAQLAASHVGITGQVLMLLSIGLMIHMVRRIGTMQVREWTHPSPEAIRITGRAPQTAAT
jgi:uncharacterized membrane protein